MGEDCRLIYPSSFPRPYAAAACMVLVTPLVWCLGDGLGLRALSGRESTGEKGGGIDAARRLDNMY